jgi:hypothetical protein
MKASLACLALVMVGCGASRSPHETKPPEPEVVPPPSAQPQTVGSGDIARPADGPHPLDQARIGGAPFTLVKNWDFGTSGTIKNTQDLIAEFEFHDQFGTIANGTHYGAVIVAPTAETAITVPHELGLPEDMQPVEDPKRPNREFTRDSLKAYVLPLSAAAERVSVREHNAGCGSFVAKWRLPGGGANLKHELLWETRARMPEPRPGYWFAIWTAGSKWNKGAEMDVLETFGAPHLMEAKVFHVNSVGGKDHWDYDNWFRSLESAGIPSSDWDLKRWHVWTWLYRTDDSYRVYYDGKLAQQGTLHWTLGGKPDAEVIDMSFLFDFTWGHTDTPGCDVALPATSFPLTYEIDYSRVYLR